MLAKHSQETWAWTVEPGHLHIPITMKAMTGSPTMISTTDKTIKCDPLHTLFEGFRAVKEYVEDSKDFLIPVVVRLNTRKEVEIKDLQVQERLFPVGEVAESF